MENNALQIFTYGKNTVRTIIKDGEPWFVAKDVCDVLGLTNSRKAISSLEDDEKMTVTESYTHSGHRGGAQFMNIINESGLYNLIFRSYKPEAKKFRRWVTHEVLPDIHKHGMYITDKNAEILRTDSETFNTVLQNYLTEKMKVKALEEKIEKDAVYTAIGRVVQALPGSISVADASLFLRQHGIKIGRNGLYKYGRQNKLLSSQKKRWNKPTQKGIDAGIVNLELDSTDGDMKFTTRTMITPEGLGNLCKFFIKEVFPLIALMEDDGTQREVSIA